MNNQIIDFSITVPGKVILSGEHSVVYGKTAVAASLNLRTTLKFSNADKEVPSVTLELPNIGFVHNFQIKDLENFLRKHDVPLLAGKYHRSFSLNSPESIDFDRLVVLVKSFVESQKLYKGSKEQERAILSFLCLFWGMFSSVDVPLPNCHIQIASELDIGAGMGSSTAYNISLATAFLQYIRRSKLKSFSELTEISKEGYKSFKYWQTNLLKLESEELALISRWGKFGDRIMHGNPSGIDNAVCTYGSIIEFRKCAGSPDIKIISDPKILKILLVNTNVRRDTKKMVSRVASLREKLDSVIDPIFQAMDSVALITCETLRRLSNITETLEPPFSESVEDTLSHEMSKLEVLIDINQKLLETLGVSHEALEHICQIAKAEDLHAKMTGAGGGGYAFVLLPFRNYDKQLCAVKMTYERYHYPAQQVVLGGPGVTLEDFSSYPILESRRSVEPVYVLSSEAIPPSEIMSKIKPSALQLTEQAEVEKDEQLDELPWHFDLRQVVKSMFESQVKADLRGSEIAIPLKSLCAVNVPAPLPLWMDKIGNIQNQIVPTWRYVNENKPCKRPDQKTVDTKDVQFGTDTDSPDDLILQDFNHKPSRDTVKVAKDRIKISPKDRLKTTPREANVSLVSGKDQGSKSVRRPSTLLNKRVSVDVYPTESELKLNPIMKEDYHIPKQGSFRERLASQVENPTKWLKDQFPPYGKREWSFGTDLEENARKLKNLEKRHKRFLKFQKSGCEYLASTNR